MTFQGLSSPSIKHAAPFRSIRDEAGWEGLPVLRARMRTSGNEWFILKFIKTGGFSMNRNRPVVGIGVAKESSYYCILAPTGEVFLKPFKAQNDRDRLKAKKKLCREEV